MSGQVYTSSTKLDILISLYLPYNYLPAQCQQRKHQQKVWNMLNVDFEQINICWDSWSIDHFGDIVDKRTSECQSLRIRGT